jgi:hypothetical protein
LLVPDSSVGIFRFELIHQAAPPNGANLGILKSMGESIKTTVLAGGIAGGAEVLIMYPLDTLK